MKIIFYPKIDLKLAILCLYKQREYLFRLKIKKTNYWD